MSKLQTISKKLLLPLALVPEYSPNASGLESEDISFRRLINVLRKRKYIVLASTVLCCLVGIGISFLMTPTYKSVAAIEVQNPHRHAAERLAELPRSSPIVRDPPNLPIPPLRLTHLSIKRRTTVSVHRALAVTARLSKLMGVHEANVGRFGGTRPFESP